MFVAFIQNTSYWLASVPSIPMNYFSKVETQKEYNMIQLY
jgi:hypothetical protein